MRTGWGPHLPIPWLPPWEGLRQEGPGELQGPLRGSKDQGRTGRLGPQPSLSLPPHVLPSHLFKMKNRKAEKQWMGGRELGGCRCGRTRSEDFRPAAHNAARWRERGLGWAFSSQRALKAGGRGQRLMGRRRAGRSSAGPRGGGGGDLGRTQAHGVTMGPGACLQGPAHVAPRPCQTPSTLSQYAVPTLWVLNGLHGSFL